MKRIESMFRSVVKKDIKIKRKSNYLEVQQKVMDYFSEKSNQELFNEKIRLKSIPKGSFSSFSFCNVLATLLLAFFTNIFNMYLSVKYDLNMVTVTVVILFLIFAYLIFLLSASWYIQKKDDYRHEYNLLKLECIDEIIKERSYKKTRYKVVPQKICKIKNSKINNK